MPALIVLATDPGSDTRNLALRLLKQQVRSLLVVVAARPSAVPWCPKIGIHMYGESICTSLQRLA